ncbi:Stealth CR1 domain-containing protein [Arthrobacter rhombi]|uniref:Stealth CR1 domain-containing protein n=1 Tax=Arthrobacter rhombi TaxID=71253 RepID=UPI003FCFDB11
MLKHYAKRVARLAKETTVGQISPWLFAANSARLGFDDETRLFRVNGIPTVGRVDSQLRLPAQRQLNFEAIRDLLTSLNLPHWILPSESNKPTLICLREGDRIRFWNAISNNKAFRHWYVSALDDRNRTSPSVAHTTSSTIGQYEATRLWEVVLASHSSSFVAGPDQGVDILFWTKNEDGLLESPVWSEQATPLTSFQADDQDSDGTPKVWSEYTHLSTTTLPIDVVYTWVDGSDPEWLRRKAATSGIVDVSTFTERAQDAARFADHDELRYSLRSLEQFAPWINKVWIVTSGQVPEWLDTTHLDIEVVSHDQIWPDSEGLPTFNSHAIEACLHRIPGLSEYFLYLNDDMILGRPVAPDLFFYPNGIGKVFQSRALIDHCATEPGEIASSSAAKNARSAVVRDFGRMATRKFYHTAAPMRVSVLADLEANNEELFASTRRANFRTTGDIAAAGSFYLNYALASGHSVPGRIRYEYIDPATADGLLRLKRVIESRSYDAFCLNDGATEQSETERVESDRAIRRALAKYLPVQSRYEKH